MQSIKQYWELRKVTLQRTLFVVYDGNVRFLRTSIGRLVYNDEAELGALVRNKGQAILR